MIPRRVRQVGYAGLWLGSPLVGYLAVKGIIGGPEVALWSGYCTLFGITAQVNLTPPPRHAQRP